MDLCFGSLGHLLGAPFFDDRFSSGLEENFSEKGGEKDLVACSSAFFGLFGRKETCWFLKMTISYFKG